MNLVYRHFIRAGAQKVPDTKTLGKLAIVLGSEIIEQSVCLPDRCSALPRSPAAQGPGSSAMVPALGYQVRQIARWCPSCHRPAYRGQRMIGVMEPRRDRHNGATR